MDAVSHPQKRRAVFWLKVAFSLLPILALFAGPWEARVYQSRVIEVLPPDWFSKPADDDQRKQAKVWWEHAQRYHAYEQLGWQGYWVGFLWVYLPGIAAWIFIAGCYTGAGNPEEAIWLVIPALLYAAVGCVAVAGYGLREG